MSLFSFNVVYGTIHCRLVGRCGIINLIIPSGTSIYLKTKLLDVENNDFIFDKLQFSFRYIIENSLSITRKPYV